MTFHELARLIDKCEEKYEDYVFVKMYGDGSGGLYAEETPIVELVTWDDEQEIEKTIKGWIKND